MGEARRKRELKEAREEVVKLGMLERRVYGKWPERAFKAAVSFPAAIVLIPYLLFLIVQACYSDNQFVWEEIL